MEELKELTEVSDIISMGAEFEKEENEVVLYLTTPEMSMSLNLEKSEWDEFNDIVKEINDKLS